MHARLPRLSWLSNRSAERSIRTGDVCRDKGEWQAAAHAYESALALKPTHDGIWVQYGHMLKEQGDLHGAVRAYRQAMACGLDDADVNLHLGHALRLYGHMLKEQGDLHGAVRAYRQAMACGLDDADVHLQLGHALKLQGQRNEAAAAYKAAFLRDPGHPDALNELQRLGWTRDQFQAALAASSWQPDPRQAAPAALRDLTWPTIAFDVSDIIHYLGISRRPTGIQRVQLNVIGALLECPPVNLGIMLVCFSGAAGSWIEIDRRLFERIVTGMAVSSRTEDARWRQLVGDVTMLLVAGEDATFPVGTRLVNLGASWAFGNYFLALRQARARHSIIYIPFIHDCIPIIAPDYFVPELQRDFREWMGSVFTHADGLLANSQATASDVGQIAAQFGYPAVSASSIPLDAIFTRTGAHADKDRGKVATSEVLTRLGLSHGRYVLFVGTIEPRKNHLLAFDAWQSMIAQRGAEHVPQLVCVGGRGWRNKATLARLNENPALQSRVTLLQGLSDDDLDALYDGCRFTIYPSHYEGWGLPITESLSKGRVALASRISSLPEAGGPFADYFTVGDAADFRSKLERLIDDDAYLDERQAEIATGFQPRSWHQIGAQIVSACLTVEAQSRTGYEPAILPYATFVRMAKDPSGSVASGVPLGEEYRSGTGWGELNERCAWLAGPGAGEEGAALLLALAPDAHCRNESVRVHVLLCAEVAILFDDEDVKTGGGADNGHRHQLAVSCQGKQIGCFRITAGQERWIAFSIPGRLITNRVLHLHIEAQSEERVIRQGRAVGVVGLFVCADDDRAAQQLFLEGVVLGAIFEPLCLRAPSDDLTEHNAVSVVA